MRMRACEDRNPTTLFVREVSPRSLEIDLLILGESAVRSGSVTYDQISAYLQKRRLSKALLSVIMVLRFLAT